MNQKRTRLFRKEKETPICTLEKSTNFIKGLSFGEDFLFYKVEKLPIFASALWGAPKPAQRWRAGCASQGAEALPGLDLGHPCLAPSLTPRVTWNLEKIKPLNTAPPPSQQST